MEISNPAPDVTAVPQGAGQVSGRCGQASGLDPPQGASRLGTHVGRRGRLEGRPHRGVFDRHEEARVLKVLVVDDQPAVCAALEILFDLSGMETLTARTPDEALALVRSEDIGVVVQDMNFRRDETSGEEGEALLRAIRALDPELPVLLMTAFQSLEAAVRLVKSGASDYIAKPWNDDKLVATV